jgi:phospholipid-binding lipoprotein MlaA
MSGPPVASGGAGRRCTAALSALVVLAGCAGTTPATGGGAGHATGLGETAGAASSPIAVYDPLEGLNRRIYKFNAQADRYVLLPIVDTYKFVVPLVLRDRVSDFFSNLVTPISFANLVLQLKFAEAAKTVLRFGANTMLGMFGLVDIASAMGLPKYDEDFGQTLGYWGVDTGSYLVLPILGPSNVRDAAGTGADLAAFSVVDPLGFFSLGYGRPGVLALNAIDSRYKQSFRYYESGSPFEYDLVRYLYTKKREVEAGRVPPASAGMAGRSMSEDDRGQQELAAGDRHAP